MGRYRRATEQTGLATPGPGSCPSAAEVPRLLSLTHEDDPLLRRLALKHLCPCRLQRKDDAVWERVFELAHDPDPGVRKEVVHALTDGSPRELGDRVLACLDELKHDRDREVRRFVARTLAAANKRGRINVN